MATNEHNPTFSNLLTAVSGSTINIVSEIDSAITDIQNYIDSTKTDIDNAITASQNNIYSHISGSTISIDSFIDAAITNINSNVDSKTSSITTIQNSILGSGDTTLGLPNLNVGSNFTERRCTTSGTDVTLFHFESPGYLWVQAYNDSASGIAEVKIYRNSISSESNLISKTYIAPQSSEICACFPALCDDECFVVGKSDGSSSLCVICQLYTVESGTQYPLNISDNCDLNRALPTTNKQGASKLNIKRYTGSDDIRNILKFDLSSIDPSSIIDSVFLELTRAYVGGSTDMHLAVVDEDCDLTQATWNERLTGTAWSVVGDGHGSLSPTPIWSGSMGGTAETAITFDVTDTVKAWLDGSVNNNGFIIYNYPSNGVNYTFYSYYESNAAKRPKLLFTML